MRSEPGGESVGEQFSRSGHLDRAPAKERADRKPPLSRYARSAQREETREGVPVESREQSRASAPPPAPVVTIERPTRVAPRTPAANREARNELLPVPSPAPAPSGPSEKRPFWKRIALHRPASTRPAPAPPSLDPILQRLDELERSLASAQRATEQRLDRFEENITRLWEMEEQIGLAEVSERLALLEATQVELADAIHSVSRNLSMLAIVLASIVAVAALMAGLLL